MILSRPPAGGACRKEIGERREESRKRRTAEKSAEAFSTLPNN
jgi:hypothetical protein